MKIEHTATSSNDPITINKICKEVVASLTEHMYVYAPYIPLDANKTSISTPNTPIVVNQNCHERPI